MSERVSFALAYVIAVVMSFVAFFTTLVLVLEFKYPNLESVGFADLHPVTVGLALCGILGAVLAFLWPGKWSVLALLVSGAFWGYFTLIFVFLLFEGRVDWVPLGQAVLALAAAEAGALLGRRFSPRARARRFG